MSSVKSRGLHCVQASISRSNRYVVHNEIIRPTSTTTRQRWRICRCIELRVCQCPLCVSVVCAGPCSQLLVDLAPPSSVAQHRHQSPTSSPTVCLIFFSSSSPRSSEPAATSFGHRQFSLHSLKHFNANEKKTKPGPYARWVWGGTKTPQ